MSETVQNILGTNPEVTYTASGKMIYTNPTTGMSVVKVMADYQCHPLWDTSPGVYGDVDPNTLPISAELKQQFADWARAFDETLDLEDPANSGFKTAEAKAAFKEQGIQLAERLQRELGPGSIVSVKV